MRWFGNRRSPDAPPVNVYVDVSETVKSLREADTQAASAALAALRAELDALRTRVDECEHIAKSARGYVTKKLSVYEDETPREDPVVRLMRGGA